MDAELDLAALPTEIRMRLRSGDGSPLVSASVNGNQTQVLPADTISLPLEKSGKYRINGCFAT